MVRLRVTVEDVTPLPPKSSAGHAVDLRIELDLRPPSTRRRYVLGLQS